METIPNRVLNNTLREIFCRWYPSLAETTFPLEQEVASQPAPGLEWSPYCLFLLLQVYCLLIFTVSHIPT